MVTVPQMYVYVTPAGGNRTVFHSRKDCATLKAKRANPVRKPRSVYPDGFYGVCRRCWPDWVVEMHNEGATA